MGDFFCDATGTLDTALSFCFLATVKWKALSYTTNIIYHVVPHKETKTKISFDDKLKILCW